MVQYWLGIRNSQVFFQLLALTTEAALAPIQSPIKTSASIPALFGLPWSKPGIAT
jgi:hypothetical protein